AHNIGNICRGGILSRRGYESVHFPAIKCNLRRSPSMRNIWRYYRARKLKRFLASQARIVWVYGKAQASWKTISARLCPELIVETSVLLHNDDYVLNGIRWYRYSTNRSGKIESKINS